ncbi:glutamate receptor U1 [Coregonus clupeaformis]|uniref:glutamate receptor U1 n=1 Tax=Coregonus clupeaformis TaxID=59861 RepID=UPI001E1C45BA|nr:glutamate receptor U1 [Coregonus clupeaformis]XP_041748724.2 glutamate receptor U1 [Coregonus clupeaformis]
MRVLLGVIMCTVVLPLSLRICAAAMRPDLTITTIKQDPYTISKGSQLEGYCMDLLSELAKKLDFKYNVHLVKDGSYGRQDESGAWNGMIGEVVRKEADLAIAPLTLTAAREKAVGMTKPFMETGISILLRKDISVEAGFFDFLIPFSVETWVGILAAYLGTAISIYVVARLSPCEWSQPQTEENSFTVSHSLWYTAGALTLQGAGPHPKALSGRIICCSWWLFSLVLLACYFSNLSTSQGSDSNQLMVKGFEDLANQQGIEYGTLSGSSTLAFFKNSNNPTYRRIYEHMERAKSFVSSMDEGVRRAKEGNFAFIGESVLLDLVVARHCELVRVHEVIGMRGYSIAGTLGSPMLKNLSVAILELSEAGELAYLRSKWWASSCMADPAKVSPLQPHSLKGMFLVLALGLGLGVLLAVLELTAKSRSNAAEQRKSYCTVLSDELSQRLRTTTTNKKRNQETADKDKA